MTKISGLILEVHLDGILPIRNQDNLDDFFPLLLFLITTFLLINKKDFEILGMWR